MKDVTIYSTPVCGFCNMAKNYFQENNVDYVEKDVSVDAEAREEMVAKTHQMGVPVIQIGNDIVVGFDQGRIAQLLAS